MAAPYARGGSAGVRHIGPASVRRGGRTAGGEPRLRAPPGAQPAVGRAFAARRSPPTGWRPDVRNRRSDVEHRGLAPTSRCTVSTADAGTTTQERPMTLVTAHMSVSLDGFYAGPEQDDVDDWTEGTEAAGFFRVTRWVINAMSWRDRQGFAGGEDDTNSQIIAEQFASAGAYVMGRRMADGGEVPWGEEPPFRAPVFVVTHRERETLHRQGGTSFTYVTDGIEAAVEQARAAAGDKNVAVAGGGGLGRQGLAARLLGEL